MQKRIEKSPYWARAHGRPHLRAPRQCRCSSYLLDIVPPDADGPARNRLAAAGLEAAVKSKPAAFFKPSLARLVTIGNFEDDLQKLAEVDWIIEAVVEDLEIKRRLLRKIEAIRKPEPSLPPTRADCPWPRSSKAFPMTSATTGSAPTSSIPALHAVAGDCPNA